MRAGTSRHIAWMYTLCIASGLIVVIFIGWVTLYFTPATYTYLWGDENTSHLYEVYRFATNHPDIGNLEAYLRDGRYKYSRDEGKGVITVYSTTAAEAVYIYFDGDRVAKVVFSPD